MPAPLRPADPSPAGPPRGPRHPAVDPAALPAARALRRRAAAVALPPGRTRPAARPGDAVALVGAIGQAGAAALGLACGPWLGARLPPADVVGLRRWADDAGVDDGWDVAAIAVRVDDALALWAGDGGARAPSTAADDAPRPSAGDGGAAAPSAGGEVIGHDVAAPAAPAGALVALGEGGLARAALRLAEASSATVRLDAGAVPLHAATARLCDVLGLNPLDLQSAGALLFTAAPAAAHAAVARLAAGGAVAAVIGAVAAGPARLVLGMGGSERPLPAVGLDAVDAVLATSV